MGQNNSQACLVPYRPLGCLNAGALEAVREGGKKEAGVLYYGSSSDQLLPRRLLAKQACDLLRRALEDKDITRARQ